MISITHDTLTFAQPVRARLSVVWAAFADSTQRAIWGVPVGEAQVYDESNFRVGGRDRYRCGPPQTLEFHGAVDYVHIIPESLIVHTDTVTVGDQILAVALLTWEFEGADDTTVIRLTDQVTSFVGTDMIDGHRNGQTKALEQLRDFVGSGGEPR
jgi:uncharacterized protein YndB with AHSA1/START domain